MKIRFARDKDYAAIARLHRQTIRNVNSKDYPEDMILVWSSQTNAKKFRDNAKRCKRWVAVQDNKIVGFCDHNLDGEFWGLYVHKNYIGQGIGSRLLKNAEKSLQKGGKKKNVIRATITAKDFYKKQGYKVVKKAFHVRENKRLPIFIMSKKLL